jgi:hypothetical protein
MFKGMWDTQTMALGAEFRGKQQSVTLVTYIRSRNMTIYWHCDSSQIDYFL